MKYIVHGFIQQAVSIEVDATSVDEAIDVASDASHREWDVWDADLNIIDVTATF